MIRPLRQCHRIMVLALTITLPAAFGIGIATRRQVPTSSVRAFAPRIETGNQTVVWTRSDLWEKVSIQTRLLTRAVSGQLAIELVSADKIIRPDLLIYWILGERKIEGSLPEDAFLLGAFEQSHSTPLVLPREAGRKTGRLVLYSLADQEIVANSKPFSAK